MNIAKAKEQILYTAAAYFSKDEDGLYRIPPREQRPVLLMGPPGIGKTAVVEQAAQEMGVGFLSYSMTHHTRQSALGLPVISQREFQGRSFQVTEYTMSEIIASVYECMENTGTAQGILFLDEVNCVSETLTPVMLQFLQYKVFGRHALPEGWMVVLAGNPPEFNRSARVFDVVTLDRLKVIDVEPDFEAWRQYAASVGTHPAVLSYLSGHRERFYEVRQGAEGKIFATARGWSDLGDMLTAFEQENIPADTDLIRQYIQHPAAAEEFAAFYELYKKYHADYRLEEILAGTEPEEIRQRAENAAFDERWSLLAMLLRRVNREISEAVLEEEVCREVHGVLKEVRDSLEDGKVGAGNGSVASGGAVGAGNGSVASDGAVGAGNEVASGGGDDHAGRLREALLHAETDLSARMERDRLRGILTKRVEKKDLRVIECFRKLKDTCAAFAEVRAAFQSRVSAMKAKCAAAGEMLENLFAFAEQVWPEGTELLMLVTELSAGYDSARFLAKHSCAGYERNAQRLSFEDRRAAMLEEAEGWYDSGNDEF